MDDAILQSNYLLHKNMVSTAADKSSEYNTYTNLLFLVATYSNILLLSNDYDTLCCTETSFSLLLITL